MSLTVQQRVRSYLEVIVEEFDELAADLAAFDEELVEAELPELRARLRFAVAEIRIVRLGLARAAEDLEG